MSAPSWEEMEDKRLQMIASFKDVAAAMSRCAAIIEGYTSLSPAPGSIKPPVSASSPVDIKKEKRHRVSKPKDPNAPKRPPSAYILFQNEVREAMRKEHPGNTYKEVMGIISQAWKDLPEGTRKIYEAAYHDAHGRYLVEEEKYTKEGVPAAVPMPGPPTLQAATEPASDGSESEDSSNSSDTDNPPTTSIAVTPGQPKPPKPMTTILPLQTPLSVTAAGVDVKKEKKRKNKEDEAAVVATLEPIGEKKKKKNKKERVLADA